MFFNNRLIKSFSCKIIYLFLDKELSSSSNNNNLIKLASLKNGILSSNRFHFSSHSQPAHILFKPIRMCQRFGSEWVSVHGVASSHCIEKYAKKYWLSWSRQKSNSILTKVSQNWPFFTSRENGIFFLYFPGNNLLIITCNTYLIRSTRSRRGCGLLNLFNPKFSNINNYCSIIIY